MVLTFLFIFLNFTYNIVDIPSEIVANIDSTSTNSRAPTSAMIGTWKLLFWDKKRQRPHLIHGRPIYCRVTNKLLTIIAFN